MNKINVFLVSLLLAVLLQEARAGVESRRMEAEGEADGVWEGKRRKIKIAREEREIEEPREPRMKGESGENLGDEGGNKRIGREANGDGISENKGYESNKERIKRKKYERIRDKQRDKRDKEKDRNIEKKAVDRKRRDKMKKRRAQTKENNVKKNTDEDKRKDDEGREQNKKDKKEETEKENKRNRNSKAKENKRNRNSKEKENKRNRNSKENERNRKKNRTGKESRVNKDDKERERNRKEHKEKPEKDTKENRNDKGRKRHKNEEKERDEKETSEERDDEGRERSRNEENRDDKREVKGKKHGRKLKKDNGDISKAARKANERQRKNENKNKNKNKVDDVALRFSSSNFRMAHCMVTYKMKENDAFLMTTDGSKQSRKCDTRFVAPKDYRLNFTCPVFNLAPTGCRREKLIVKDTNVKMTFCTNDDVDLASTGNSLNVKHKRKKTKSKECAGTYMCEVTVVRQDLASSLGEGSGGQSASVATDPTNSASKSSALQATFEMSDPVPTSSSSSSSASQSSRTTLSSTPAFFTAAQTTESLPEAVFPEFTQISTAPLAPSPPTVAPVTLPPPLPVPTESLPQEVFPEFTQIPTAPLAPSPPTVAPVTLPPPLPVPAPPAPPPPPPLPPAPAPAPPLPPSILPAPQPTLTDALPPTATTTPAATTAAASQDRLFCSNCGLSKITFPRIVGGQAAIRGEFPWQVGIKMDWGGRCGGSLIKHRWVITAGHCYMRGFTASTVYLGDHDRSVNEEGSYEIKAESVMVHPGFDSLTLDNDIALLKLSSPATFSSTVAPVCLARPSEVPVSGKGITTGWGTTTWQGTTATVLQKVAVDYISNAWCNQLYSDRYDITDNMVCTYTLGKDACQGDSGGPLISLAADGRWVLTGVVSFGDQCAKENSPGVFTRASKYISWIEENTPDDDC